MPRVAVSSISLFTLCSLLISQTVLPPSNSAVAQQDPLRPTLTPPAPGIGIGGSGPGGSFNVDPPSRLQGPPPGVRDMVELLNDPRTQPRVPDPIPSTSSYCWPGDPA